MLEVWMSIIGISMALSGIPQIVKLIKLKSSNEVSLSLWFIILNGQCWWIYFGFVKDSISLIITNFVCVLINIIVIWLIIKYRTPTSRDD